jgi:hypothetical protein
LEDNNIFPANGSKQIFRKGPTGSLAKIESIRNPQKNNAVAAQLPLKNFCGRKSEIRRPTLPEELRRISRRPGGRLFS